VATYGTQLVDIAFLERSPFRKQHERLSKDDVGADEIALAEKHGILQVIVARPFQRSGSTFYEMLDDERAWLLAQIIQVPKVLVQIVPMTDTAAREYVRRSTTQRAKASHTADNPVDLARALPAPQKNKARTGVPRNKQAANSHLRAFLRMHRSVVSMIEKQEISKSHARVIKADGLSKEKQLELAKLIVRKKLTVRATEAAVREVLAGKVLPSSAGRDPDRQRLEEKIGREIGYPARYRDGWLQLNIGEEDEANRFLERIGAILDD